VITYFKQNFIRLSSVKHPDILQCYTFDIIETVNGEYQAKPQFFYVYEYFEAEPINYLSLKKDETLEVLFKVAYAVNYLHFRGLVYKYLNFENIIIYKNQSGELSVKLLDLATIELRTNIYSNTSSRDNQFIAPEVLWEENIGTQADTYSLGKIFFYLYHKIPYETRGLEEFLANPTDNEIQKLISKMLIASSSEGIGTVYDFLKKISFMFRRNFEFLDYNHYNQLQENTKYIERYNEITNFMNTMKGKFERKRTDNGILVLGDRGLGKSRLLKEVMKLSRWEKYRTISININHLENQEYAFLKEVLRSIFNYDDVNPELISKYGQELVKVLPEKSDIWNIKPSDILLGENEILRLNNRIYNFILDYSMQKKLVIIIDNIEKLEGYHIGLIDEFLKCQREHSPFFVLGVNQSRLENEQFLKWKTYSAVKVHEMTKFNYDEAAKMVQSVLGIAYRPISFTAKLMMEAFGNPMNIQVLIKQLYENHFIYVEPKEMGWNLSQDYNLKEFEVSYKKDMKTSSVIKTMPDSYMEVLEAISIFDNPISSQIINNIVAHPIGELNEELNELVRLSVLIEKLGDWGYTYEFNARAGRREVLNNIDEDKRVEMHRNAAEHLEKLYKEEGKYHTDSLIYHLSHCGEYKRAIQFCIESAKHMLRLNMYSQSIEFYNKAENLMNYHNDDVLLAEVLYMTGLIYNLLGETDVAKDTFEKTIGIAIQGEDRRILAKALSSLAEILIDRKELEKGYGLLEQCIRVSEKANYLEGALKGKLVLGYYYLAKREKNLLSEIVEEALEVLDEHPNNDLIANFLNLKGLLFLNHLDITKSNDCFEESIQYFRKAKYNYDIVKPLNNLGKIHADFIGDLRKARRYYAQAVQISETFNTKSKQTLGFINMGDVHFLESKFDLALEYLTKALRLIDKTKNKEHLFLVCIKLCKLYLEINDYDKASFYLRKLDGEFEYSKDQGENIDEYYFVHLLYFINIKNIEYAEKWLFEFKDHLSTTDFSAPFTSIMLKIREYEISKMKKRQLNIISEIDLNFVDVIMKVYTTEKEIIEIRKLIHSLIIDLIGNQKFIDVHYLLEEDRTLAEIFDTSNFRLQRKVFEGVLKENRIEYFEEMLVNYADEILSETKWFLFKVLGDEHFIQNDYFSAISNYYSSLDIIRQLTEEIPIEYKEFYIYCDEVKLELKTKINRVQNRILGFDGGKQVFREIEIRRIDDFFDMNTIKKLVRNNIILTSVRELYNMRFNIQLNSVNNLIENFGNDELVNIELILKYCTQLFIAERGFIYIVDENNDIQEIISTDETQEPPDLQRILKSIANVRNDLMASSVENDTQRTLLEGNQKAMLCIPIMKADMEQQNRRRNGDKIQEHDIHGYLYLDTTKIFNSFNDETYEDLRSLRNLLFFLVDNYNLKKFSTVDKLTEVYLRKYIEDLFNRELQKAKSNNTKLSVIMCDIDKFKSVNDYYGHRKGDEILKNISRIMKDSLRSTDLVGRYGGEEFIIILPNTNSEDAFAICEKIRTNIEKARLLGDDRPLTISLGISTHPFHGSTEDDLVEKADQALYYSKNMGRNLTTSWNINIGSQNYRFDKLAGILIGEISSDTRNVQALVDVMEVTKLGISKEEKVDLILRNLMDITEADAGAIVEVEKGTLGNTFSRKIGTEEFGVERLVSDEIIQRFIGVEEGEFFIDWSACGEDTCGDRVPNWKAVIAVPLIFNGKQNGVLVLAVAISKKEFDFNAFNYVDSICGVISSVL